MTEVALYRLDVDAGADGGYGITVAQIVVTGVRTANRRDRFLIVAVDCRLCQVMPRASVNTKSLSSQAQPAMRRCCACSALR